MFQSSAQFRKYTFTMVPVLAIVVLALRSLEPDQAVICLAGTIVGSLFHLFIGFPAKLRVEEADGAQDIVHDWVEPPRLFRTDSGKIRV